MEEENFQLFGGSWTERKLEVLSRYLSAFAKALSKQKFKRLYIDAFAGTGYREQRTGASNASLELFSGVLDDLRDIEPQQFLDGSARIALRVEPAFHRYYFVERSEKKARELERLKKEFPARASAISILASDANRTIQEMCQNWDNSCRGVLFLDPFGMQVEWQTIEAIARTGCIDTWILFPLSSNRLMMQSPRQIPQGWQDRLNKLFGTAEWEQRFYQEDLIEDLFEAPRTEVHKELTLEALGAYYAQRLKTVFPVVAPNAPILRSEKNRPLFQLFFAAANKGTGGKLAVKIAHHILEHI